MIEDVLNLLEDEDELEVEEELEEEAGAAVEEVVELDEPDGVLVVEVIEEVLVGVEVGVFVAVDAPRATNSSRVYIRGVELSAQFEDNCE
jgi:hypothetical protein